MYTELFLIRHGCTDYNKDGKYCSFTNIPVNPKGVSQIIALREKRSIPSPQVIYASRYKRAYQTARLLFPDRKIEITPALAELDFGLWEGLTSGEILREYGDCYRNWLSNPQVYSPPSGEKFSDLEKRVVDFLTEMLAAHQDKKIVCVSHAGTIKIMVCHLLNRKLRSFWKIKIDFATLSYFKLSKQKVVEHYLNRE